MAKDNARNLHSVPTYPMVLSPKLTIDVDRIIGEGILINGIKGSGKSSLGRLFAEQFGQYHIPMTIFDIEGDYASLVDHLPRGFLATAWNCPTGRDVLEK